MADLKPIKATPALLDVIHSWELPGISEQMRSSQQLLVVEDDGLQLAPVAVVLHHEDYQALLMAAGRTH